MASGWGWAAVCTTNQAEQIARANSGSRNQSEICCPPLHAEGRKGSGFRAGAVPEYIVCCLTSLSQWQSAGPARSAAVSRHAGNWQGEEQKRVLHSYQPHRWLWYHLISDFWRKCLDFTRRTKVEGYCSPHVLVARHVRRRPRPASRRQRARVV